MKRRLHVYVMVTAGLLVAACSSTSSSSDDRSSVAAAVDADADTDADTVADGSSDGSSDVSASTPPDEEAGGASTVVSDGSTADPSDTTDSSDAPAQGPPDGPPIKLVLIYEESSGVANSDLPDGAEAAIEAINGDGGVGGRPLELIVCDTGNDPNRAADCANDAVDDGVVASVGNFSQHGDSYFPILLEHEIAVIGEAPATPVSYTSPAAFPTTGGAASQIAGMARYVSDAGATTISVVRPDIAGGEAVRVFADLGLAPVDAAVTNDVAVPIDAPDMASYAESALSNGTDGLIIELPGPQAINFIQAAKQVNPDVVIALGTSNHDQVLDALGDDGEGQIQAQLILPASIDTAGTRQYRDDMDAAGFDVGGSRILSYLAVRVFAAVAGDLPDVTAPAVFSALSTITDLETGLTPPLQWTTGGIGGLPRVFNPCTLATVIRDGEEVAVDGVTFLDPFTDTPCPTPA